MHASCNMLRLSKDFPRRLPRQSLWLFLWHLHTRWWFEIFFIFSPIWGRFPSWLSGLKPPTSHIFLPEISLRSTSICGSDFYLAPEVIKQEDSTGGEASAKPQIVDLDWNIMKHQCSQSILQNLAKYGNCCLNRRTYVACPILKAPGQIELVILRALLSLTNKSLALGSAH